MCTQIHFLHVVPPCQISAHLSSRFTRQSAINTQGIHNSVSTLAPPWWWCRYSAQRTCWSAPPTWSSTSPPMTPSGWWCRYWTNSRRAYTSDLPINFLRSLLRKLVHGSDRSFRYLELPCLRSIDKPCCPSSRICSTNMKLYNTSMKHHLMSIIYSFLLISKSTNFNLRQLCKYFKTIFIFLK